VLPVDGVDAAAVRTAGWGLRRRSHRQPRARYGRRRL